MPGNKWVLKPVQRVIGPSIAYVPLTQGLFAMIDIEDADVVGRYNWRAAYRDRGRCFYAVRSQKREGKPHIEQSMHVFLLGYVGGLQVDHIHGKTLDNRRSQLRRATKSQQKMNSGMYASNTTGIKGIYWRERDQQWSASISVRCHLMHLGQYDLREDAIAAREAAEKKYFGEFARVIK